MVTQISYFTLDSNLILTKSQRLIEKLRWREDNLCKSDYKIIVFLLLKRRNNRIMAMDFKKPNKTKQTSESGSVGQPWHESVFMRQGHLSASKRENDKKNLLNTRSIKHKGANTLNHYLKKTLCWILLKLRIRCSFSAPLPLPVMRWIFSLNQCDNSSIVLLIMIYLPWRKWRIM